MSCPAVPCMRTTRWLRWDTSSSVPACWVYSLRSARSRGTRCLPKCLPAIPKIMPACTLLQQVRACLPLSGCLQLSSGSLPGSSSEHSPSGSEPKAPAPARPFPAPQTHYATRACQGPASTGPGSHTPDKLIRDTQWSQRPQGGCLPLNRNMPRAHTTLRAASKGPAPQLNQGLWRGAVRGARGQA